MQFRDLPSVDSVLSQAPLVEVLSVYRRDWVVDRVRQQLELAREQVRQGGGAPTPVEVAEDVRHSVEVLTQPAPRPVINATGVIIHTNLGRAPLSHTAAEAAVRAARGYSDLELELGTGRRGSRQAHLQSLLQQLTGAEAALVVNNNA
ncbi:MAG TPA: L-seryl-tRNA(Sec) selenium transferase, partial [Dehalococcoidia bacterium]|nr:L-seryl-tRNA(Sec) selenium transferase [Dehalococcoidia bacterium]